MLQAWLDNPSQARFLKGYFPKATCFAGGSSISAGKNHVLTGPNASCNGTLRRPKPYPLKKKASTGLMAGPNIWACLNTGDPFTDCKGAPEGNHQTGMVPNFEKPPIQKPTTNSKPNGSFWPLKMIRGCPKLVSQNGVHLLLFPAVRPDFVSGSRKFPASRLRAFSHQLQLCLGASRLFCCRGWGSWHRTHPFARRRSRARETPGLGPFGPILRLAWAREGTPGKDN